LFGGSEVVEFLEPSEGFLFWGRLVCFGEVEEEEGGGGEESGFCGRVALVITMDLVIERLLHKQNIAEWVLCFVASQNNNCALYNNDKIRTCP